MHHVVMLHPKTIIQRPPAGCFDTGNVIKADQFPTWHEKFIDKLGTGAVFKRMFKPDHPDAIEDS